MIGKKYFADFISNNRDKNRKLSNLLVKICFYFNNNFFLLYLESN